MSSRLRQRLSWGDIDDVATVFTSDPRVAARALMYLLVGVGTAIIVWQVTGDGEATPFEGAALIAAYVILATVAAFET